LRADLFADTRNKLTRKKPDLDRAFKLVNRFQKLHSELGNVILIRGDGRILLTGTTHNNRDLPTLAKDSAFMDIRSELQQGPPFVIGKPVMGTIDKSWVAAARYAVADKDGKLAYILSANLPANLLLRYRPESASPRITALGLVRDNGYLVSRYPEPDAAKLDDIYGKPAAGAMIEYLRANNYPQSGQVDMPGSDGKRDSFAGAAPLAALSRHAVCRDADVGDQGGKVAKDACSICPDGAVAGGHICILWHVAA